MKQDDINPEPKISENVSETAQSAFIKLTELFGPPPLQKDENRDQFKEAFIRFFSAYNPEDFMVITLVYQLAIETWRAFCLMRYQALSLEDSVRKQIDEQKQCYFKEGMQMIPGKRLNGPKDDPDYTEAIRNLRKEVNELFETTNDRDYALAFNMNDDGKLDLRINRVLKRRDAILRQIATYRSMNTEVRRRLSQKRVPPGDVSIIPAER